MPAQPETPMLFRRYQVVRELGRGGMGVVMLATDTHLEIPVAVKLVPELVVKDTEAVSDLRKEVLRGMALMHPCIVRTHNFERDESGAGIIMEYVDGETLTDLKLKQPKSCFEPEQILPWLDQLCSVLEYAHRDAQIVHRDLKPRNIMLTRSGKVKVADFGIAAVLSDSLSRHSMEGKVSGTLSYMSPQQAQGMRPSPLDDIHALGATIYELLTGKPPFFRGNPATILAQIQTAIPPTMTERRVDLETTTGRPLPRHWEETIAACLTKDPERRPQSAGELLGRLKGETITVAPSPAPIPPPPVLPPAPRGGIPWVPILGGGLAALVVISGAALWWLAGQRSTSRTAESAPTPITQLATPSPKPAPTARQLLTEARALRASEANLLARQRLEAALVLEPNNPEVLSELAAVRALLAPPVPTPTPPPVPATPPPSTPPPPTPTPPPAPTAPDASVSLVRRVNVSSILGSQVDDNGRSNSYSGRNVFDGKLSTAWVAARGARDIWMRIEFERPVRVNRFSIFPGYGKDADAFAKNNRVKAFSLEFPGGRQFTFRCADRREMQSYQLPEEVITSEVTLRVQEVYRTKVFDGDTPISEIDFR